ncbi:MAG: 3'(2'),5'-bisphosphate nucleotidase CysQ [Patescibacteria group bacterium]
MKRIPREGMKLLPDERLNELVELLDAAGEKILEISKGGFLAYQKSDSSPVTDADLASEAILHKGLEKLGGGILSEEATPDDSDIFRDGVWIVDPLDGTRGFIEGTGEFSVMVGFVDKEEVQLGITHIPAQKTFYLAQRERGAYLLNQQGEMERIHTSSVAVLGEARILVSRFHLEHRDQLFLQEHCKVKHLLSCGSIGVKLALIAQGKAEGYLTRTDHTSWWDICAPDLILREAGGMVTDTKGERFRYHGREVKNPNGIVAANPFIHSQLIEKLSLL